MKKRKKMKMKIVIKFSLLVRLRNKLVQITNDETCYLIHMKMDKLGCRWRRR